MFLLLASENKKEQFPDFTRRVMLARGVRGGVERGSITPEIFAVSES